MYIYIYTRINKSFHHPNIINIPRNHSKTYTTESPHLTGTQVHRLPLGYETLGFGGSPDFGRTFYGRVKFCYV